MLDELHGANLFSKMILKVVIIKLKNGMNGKLLLKPSLDYMSG